MYSRLPESIDRDRLPTIDVLLPAYKEGNVIGQSIESIRSADYPQELLRIHVLVEPGDSETRTALERLPCPYTEIVVPDDYPGRPNKPRALNYGFEVTDSELVGIIDAEDIVDSKLFLNVANALSIEGFDYVQGKIDMVNEGDGWRNLVFRGEYAFWYRLLLPSFHFVGYPVPLGGTTNFFHRTVLEQASQTRVEEYGDGWSEDDRHWLSEHHLHGYVPWDPRNVTEDFELGILLWKEGHEMTLIESVTREESPIGINAWIRQRTRWQKGKLYTFVQYTRHPPATGSAKFHGLFQSFLPHLAPVNIVGVVVLTMVANLLQFRVPLAVWAVLTLGVVFVVEMFAFHAGGYWLVSEEPSRRRAVRALSIPLVVPLYWVILWGAELRAIKQLYSNQLHWEKTEHHGRNATKDS
ncbi:glycosyltransferase [Haloferax sp. CBA1150]|uniref:Glycosyltransferase n=1 Tax=Haloferax marinum TaxID=2666143 RepID=A0A6A8G9B3_9EURY|nr:glycosyltransferase [Haloferax sp. CBA1150]KAB1198545.1 glycosyltransferase [Haloferax sp. CBA1150]MRW97654.1 glycosyltransferase [Haloferax marinum]